MDRFVDWIIARLKEPTTYAGTGILALVIQNVVLSPELADALVRALPAICGILAVLLKEKKSVIVADKAQMKVIVEQDRKDHE